MKVFIVGLGLIGASYAESLTRLGHTVYGYDSNQSTCELAIREGVIKKCDMAYLSDVDLVVLALYPKAIVDFIEVHKERFKVGQVITDVSGVKSKLVPEIEGILPSGVDYVSHHPMAGKEKPGYTFKDSSMFRGANAILIQTEKTNDEALRTVETLLRTMGFKRCVTASPNEHDQKIAKTSQLPHALAMALVNTVNDDQILPYTGNSFRDLTRVASINQALWGELFSDNKEALVESLEGIIDELLKIKEFVENKDIRLLENYMESSKEKRNRYGSD